MAANRGSVAQRRWASPLSVIIGGQAVLYSVIGASNLADLLGEAFGWSDAAWRSGNVSFVEYAIGKGHIGFGSPGVWALITVILATALELLAAFRFAGAWRAIATGTDPGRPVRSAVSIAVLNWMVLAVGTELFIIYEAASWEKFVLLTVLAVLTWLAVEFVGDDRTAR